MGEKDVFVKRVDFDLNGKDDTDKTPLNEVHNSDVEKLTDPVPSKPSCLVKFLVFIDKYGIKAALSHIGLLIALGLYCYAGGYVISVLNLKPLFSEKVIITHLGCLWHVPVVPISLELRSFWNV